MAGLFDQNAIMLMIPFLHSRKINADSISIPTLGRGLERYCFSLKYTGPVGFYEEKKNVFL
jgi:hypothetical protein